MPIITLSAEKMLRKEFVERAILTKMKPQLYFLDIFPVVDLGGATTFTSFIDDKNAEDDFSDGFAYNDLECVKFNFIFFDEYGNECIPYNVGTYRIEFDTNNIEVLNEDIYRNYEIVGFETGTLTITPYSIYVSPLMENNQKEYDGNYYYYPTGNGNYVLENSELIKKLTSSKEKLNKDDEVLSLIKKFNNGINNIPPIIITLPIKRYIFL